MITLQWPLWRTRRDRIRTSPFWLTRMSDADMQRLATYNSERSRGITHAPEYVERMCRLQAAYERCRYENCVAAGDIWLGDPPPNPIRAAR